MRELPAADAPGDVRQNDAGENRKQEEQHVEQKSYHLFQQGR